MKTIKTGNVEMRVLDSMDPPNVEPFCPVRNIPPVGISGWFSFHLRQLLDLQVSSVYAELKSFTKGLTGKILDVGCGVQPYRGLFSKTCQYTGLDWRGAGESFGYSTPDTVYYDGTTFPFSDGAFDAVVHTEVLEHVSDYACFLQECRRVLKPGGRMFFSIPFSARCHYMPRDYWRFTRTGLAIILEKEGFSNIHVKERGTDVTTMFYKAQSVCIRLFMDRSGSPAWILSRWIMGVLLSPCAMLCTMFGQLSRFLGLGSMDDPLGYAVTCHTRGSCENNGRFL